MRAGQGIAVAEAPVWAQGVDVRSAFIIKTYAHLLGAILAFVGIEAAIFASGSAEWLSKWMFALPGGWMSVLGGFLLTSWIASRAAHSAQSLSVQYAALAAFVLAEAIIFVPLLFVAGNHYPGVISSAAVVTAGGFAALTGIAFVTRKDFSFLRTLLMWGGICALGLIVAGVIFGFTLGPVFSVAMICLAGGAILYDTSNVLHHYPSDRYVAASLELFASVALLLWYVIRLLMSLRD